MLASLVLSCSLAASLISPVISRSPVAVVFAMRGGQQRDSCVAGLQDPSPDGSPSLVPSSNPTRNSRPHRELRIRWSNLGRDSLEFLALVHGFRWLAEPPTRAGGIGLGSSYWNALGNLHGWGDGDPFYVNYVAHPMQGSISGRLFQLNDLRYSRTEFGKAAEYWKGKLRATAFAWAFSEQFEIGLLSEASIGHVQAYYPQQGFADHVITPALGFAWMVTEDMLDRYLIRHFEGRHENKWLRLALRTGLNPARSVANVIDGRAPWDRASRAGILSYRPQLDRKVEIVEVPISHEERPAPWEFAISSGWRQFAGGPCMGGGAEAAYRIRPELRLVLAVNGCKLLDLPRNLSGDGLVFQTGLRWTPAPRRKWSPYAHLLLGGIKITHELFNSHEKAALATANREPDQPDTLHGQYTSHEESTALAISAGTGVDYKLNEALALRVASVEYLRSGIGSIGGISYSGGLEISTGIVLRLGTW